MPYADPEDARAYQRRKKAERLQTMRAYLGGCCIVCGSKRNLEFHHKNPTEKEFDFNQRWTKPWAQIYAELDKCELRCHRHHKAEHVALHGTVSRYTSPFHKCRCVACVKAYRAYDRRKHQRYRDEVNILP